MLDLYDPGIPSGATNGVKVSNSGGLGYALVTPLLAFAQGFALLGLALDVLSGAHGLEHLTALCAGEPPVGTDIWRGHTKFSETGRSDFDDSGLMAMRAAISLRWWLLPLNPYIAQQ